MGQHLTDTQKRLLVGLFDRSQEERNHPAIRTRWVIFLLGWVTGSVATASLLSFLS